MKLVKALLAMGMMMSAAAHADLGGADCAKHASNTAFDNQQAVAAEVKADTTRTASIDNPNTKADGQLD